jgi:hypothetical protein
MGNFWLLEPPINGMKGAWKAVSLFEERFFWSQEDEYP